MFFTYPRTARTITILKKTVKYLTKLRKRFSPSLNINFKNVSQVAAITLSTGLCIIS